MDYEPLKKLTEEKQMDITCRIKPSGEALIYVSPDANPEEVTKALIQASLEIAKVKVGHHEN